MLICKIHSRRQDRQPTRSSHLGTWFHFLLWEIVYYVIRCLSGFSVARRGWNLEVDHWMGILDPVVIIPEVSGQSYYHSSAVHSLVSWGSCMCWAVACRLRTYKYSIDAGLIRFTGVHKSSRQKCNMFGMYSIANQEKIVEVQHMSQSTTHNLQQFPEVLWSVVTEGTGGAVTIFIISIYTHKLLF